jgi:hypothetical protein
MHQDALSTSFGPVNHIPRRLPLANPADAVVLLCVDHGFGCLLPFSPRRNDWLMAVWISDTRDRARSTRERTPQLSTSAMLNRVFPAVCDRLERIEILERGEPF